MKKVDKGYYEICFYNKQHQKVAKTKIDKDDFKKVKDYKWHIDRKGYAVATNPLQLHRLIMNTPKDFVTDHINHDKLDNRKQNLRIVTRSQNNMNQKNVKGYCWHKRRNKWMAHIRINRKSIHLGYFDKKEDAIKIRKQAEKKYFGEYAYKLR